MDHMEMSALSRNPSGIRSLAATITALLGTAISDNERDFLTKLERFSDADNLSVRQREFLWALREKTTRSCVQGGYRARTLVQLLWEARYDLSDEHEENLERMRSFGDQLTISRSQWRWVFALCREMNIIEDEFISLN